MTHRTSVHTGRRRVERCMGTVFSVDIRDPVPEDAVEEVFAWLHRMDATFSTYRADSDISRLRRGETAPADCAPEVAEILSRCAELHEATGGYFDAYASGVLDPSGYVKGWAVERASDLLRAAGSVNHCVNGGGDVQCLGTPAPGRPWQVGIADPTDRTHIIGVMSGTPLAVATSGTSERGGHILDPRTARPADAFLSVTVAGRRLGEVDAYATAAFAMGDRAPGWLARTGYSALLARPDGTCLRIDP